MQTRTPWLILRSLILTYMVSALLLFALSFALYKFRLPESQVGLAVNAIYVVSCLIGGFLSGKAIRTRRFFWGLLTGLCYFAVLFLMSFLRDSGITEGVPRILTVLALCAAGGMAGGMIS